ncbi:DUF2155 domain-containing protein [Bosea sp. (in: a-proteobacteria)]|jgi:hypothetical protein|uniref:DUF2155 domain-containing protein n=1 Tax=Bosea sp. (in: a-proteobacteria) TaxID=1871050 RepID=UPI0027347019|nr:DUF2155 domain-containing protein [Bosea sp. (in: a-proteobacteria)]MDP3406744.1 DUF2155 domain-containing protein [Bosea sp. (in: a-proteobacteria)]
MPSPFRHPVLAGLVSSTLLSLALTGPASADRIRNPTAVFAGLDKITGRIISFEVAVDETVQFGALQLTPRVCWTRPPTEAPQTTTFTEVDEVTFNNEYRRIFTGWMYAASPGLHGVEHAIYDVWLTDCKGGTELVVDPKEPEAPIAEEPRRPRTAPARDVNQQPGLPPPPAPGQRIDVLPPQGVPVAPRQAPSQRFFPTNPGRDPTGGN